MVRKSQTAAHIVGHRVRTRRKELRLTQTRLAEMAETSCSQLSAVEHNQVGISLRNAVAIADALDTSLEFLLGRVDDPRPAQEITCELKAQAARVRDLEEGRAEPRASD